MFSGMVPVGGIREEAREDAFSVGLITIRSCMYMLSAVEEEDRRDANAFFAAASGAR